MFLHTDDEALLARLDLHGDAGSEAPTLSEEHRILLDAFFESSSLPIQALAGRLGATHSSTSTYEIQVFGGEYGAPPVVDDEEGHLKLNPYNVIGASHQPTGRLHEDESFIVAASRRFGTGKHGRLLSSHPLEGPPSQDLPRPSVQVHATDLRMDIDIVPNDTFTRLDATANVTLGPNGRDATAVFLKLSGGLTDEPLEQGMRTPLLVTSVTDPEGNSLPFLHRRGRLLVQLASPLFDATTTQLAISYAGSGVKKEGMSHFGLFANWDWFPQASARTHMDWKATVCIPEGPLLAGTGVTLSSEIIDGRLCEVHKAASPVNFPALNMGWWANASRQSDETTLNAWFDRKQTVQLQPALDITEHILSVYADFFGPLPHREVDVAQGRNHRGFWQAPDGLVEMSANADIANTFAKKVLKQDFIPDFDSYILAHELGHQYWGHVVGWGSYRDQWISESFAEYSAYMYVLRTNGDAAGHHRYWRRSSVKSGRSGVTTLGVRNGRGLYQDLVYSRGPLIIHMFRDMVGDEAFLTWMRTLVDVARKKQTLTTEDLIVIAEHVTGPDARWFWEQWLLEPVVPDLHATWDNGSAGVTLTLSQSMTPQPLRLIVPVLVRSKKGPEFDVTYSVALGAESITVELQEPMGGTKDVVIDPQEEMVRGEATTSRKKQTSRRFSHRGGLSSTR